MATADVATNRIKFDGDDIESAKGIGLALAHRVLGILPGAVWSNLVASGKSSTSKLVRTTSS